MTSIHRAVEPRSTTTTPTSAARKQSWRRLTAMTHSAAASQSSTDAITTVVAKKVTTSPLRSAAAEKSRSLSSGRTRVAARRPCMITERACAVMVSCIASRPDGTQLPAAAPKSTDPITRFAVTTAMCLILLSIQRQLLSVILRFILLLLNVIILLHVMLYLILTKNTASIEDFSIVCFCQYEKSNLRITLPFR